MDLPLRVFAARLREREPALAWLTTNIPNPLPSPNAANEAYLLELARLMAALDRRPEAVGLLDHLIEFAQRNGRTHSLIQAKVVRASLSDQAEDLCDALRLAKPEGYISTFIDAGAPVQRLLRMMLKQASAGDGLADYIRDLLLAFDPAVQKPAPAAGVD